MKEHFGDKDALSYNNIEELISLIKHYLNNPKEAEIIANNGCNVILQHDTIYHRREKLLKIIGEEL